MKTEILEYEFGDEYIGYKLDIGNGTKLVDLNELLDAHVTEWSWVDDTQNYLLAKYSEWEGTEHLAIISKDGCLVRRGILELVEYIEEEQFFVVEFSGFGLGEEDAIYHCVAHDDWRFAVIDRNGEFVLPPDDDKRIIYLEEAKMFQIDEAIYDLSGNRLDEIGIEFRLSDDIWEAINEVFYNKGGIYKLYAKDGKKVVPINRLLQTDYEGILYLGMTNNFVDRVIELKKSVSPNHESSNHEAGYKLKNISELKSKFPYESLYVRLKGYDAPAISEKTALLFYLEEFGELPPLNRNN